MGAGGEDLKILVNCTNSYIVYHSGHYIVYLFFFLRFTLIYITFFLTHKNTLIPHESSIQKGHQPQGPRSLHGVRQSLHQDWIKN